MKIILKIEDLARIFQMDNRKMRYFVEKHDIYREKNEKTGRYIYTQKSVEEIKIMLDILR